MILSFGVAADSQVEGLRMLEVAILDEAGSVITRGIAPIELRLWLPGLDLKISNLYFAVQRLKLK